MPVVGVEAPATLAIPSCGRPSELKRCIESFQRLAGRRLSLRIYDDSRGSETREMLAQLGHAELGYVNRSSRAVYAAALARETALDPRFVRWALVGEEAQTTTGANRNAMLLDLQGRTFLAVDDDMVGRTFGSSEPRGALAFKSRSPWQLRLFAEREQALANANENSADFCGEHAALLGQELLVAQRDGAAASKVVPHRIALTANGVVGHSGWGSFGLLALASIPGALDAVSPEQALSCELLRDVPRATATRDSWCQTMALGYDNRGFLPPFKPSGRGEDDVFGATLRSCDPSALLAYLPTALLHAPSPRRLDPDHLWRGSTAGFTHSLQVLVTRFTTTATELGPRQRLVALGTTLQALAQQPVELKQALDAQHEQAVAALEERWAATPPHVPEIWQPLLERCRRHYAEQPPTLAPQALDQLALIGQLYTAWPTLCEGAATLRQKGVQLATPISSAA